MQKFEKGWVGGELGIFKKEGGCSCKQHQGEHWKTMLKISLVILRGARLTPPTPLNTPLKVMIRNIIS